MSLCQCDEMGFRLTLSHAVTFSPIKGTKAIILCVVVLKSIAWNLGEAAHSLSVGLFPIYHVDDHSEDNDIDFNPESPRSIHTRIIQIVSRSRYIASYGRDLA